MGPPAKKGFAGRQIMVLVSTRLRTYIIAQKLTKFIL